MNQTQVEATHQAARPGALHRFFRSQEAGLVMVTLILAAGLAIYGHFDAQRMGPSAQNTFLSPRNLLDGVATPMSYFAIMAIGMTCVIIAGGIDISVGSAMACSAYAGAFALMAMPVDSPAWMVVAIGVLAPTFTGVACGLLNGALVVGLNLHPFIVTLGTMSVLRFLAIHLPGGTMPAFGAKLPAAFTDGFMRIRTAGGLEPMPMLIMLTVAVAGYIYLHRMVWGRENYALGGNEQASRFSGLGVRAIKLRSYAIVGMTAGLAGMVSLGRFGTASTTTGNGYELTVVAAAVVGGASLAGGRGSVLGAMLGALVLTLINNAIDIVRLPSNYTLLITGSAIIVAAAIDRFGQRVAER